MAHQVAQAQRRTVLRGEALVVGAFVRCWECPWQGERADCGGEQSTRKVTDLYCPECWGPVIETAERLDLTPQAEDKTDGKRDD